MPNPGGTAVHLCELVANQHSPAKPAHSYVAFSYDKKLGNTPGGRYSPNAVRWQMPNYEIRHISFHCFDLKRPPKQRPMWFRCVLRRPSRYVGDAFAVADVVVNSVQRG